ncbi:Bug family tripartite tricarboxylate transporter substrate binding protein [Rhodoplanes sp. Z2-YC6860]|uniref:Bug family tripartite tricarboxylate transporter substrate binding protein n=1 Tax=Rhodoplanes sp. Z2-YC6860 TaxID=674703 RepID=UPI00078C8DC6|nr:tripartite tricarboxylate transporter substrate binding protein [Rhodoplanes sp. Z2-YC6860]AMN39515.1 extra-cytoplasmic solute receptor protein [Rhodoplanes sp. Z2-YC6860]
MMPRSLAACAVMIAALTSAVDGQAHAQGFPDRLIRIIIPFTPGGSNDIVGRELANGFQERFKQNAVVENRPGGGGVIAYAGVAKSPPDGYTLLIAPVSFTITPHLTRTPTFDPVHDFAPINLVADVPFVMVVPSSLPVHTVKEFVELAKSSPSKLSYASVGAGTPQHLGPELFKLKAGIDMVHVPFRGAIAAIPDLLAGRVHVFIGAINSLLPLIREGKLRALASAGTSRIAALPDVPTMAEAGFPGVEVGSGVGLVAPAGTPPDVIETLHRATADIIATPGYQERMTAIGVVTVGTTPQEYGRIISEEYVKWGKVVAAAGITPE